MTKIRIKVVVLDVYPTSAIEYNFVKTKGKIEVWINFRSEINVITFAYALKLALIIQKIYDSAQKIHSSNFTTYEMIIASFLL